MIELHDIVTSLLEWDDGSCRDLNFEAPTWAGVDALLASLEGASEEVGGTDQNGECLLPPFRLSALAVTQKHMSAHLFFKIGTGLIKNLQVFVCSEEDASPFVELTFFPEDVEQTSSLRSDFIAWVQQMQLRLGARRYYARYENASWQFGDIGAQSGVFLVSNEIAQDV
jgi:hypothetical protein